MDARRIQYWEKLRTQCAMKNKSVKEYQRAVKASEKLERHIMCNLKELLELALDGLKYRQVKNLEVLGYSMSVEMYLNEIIRPKD